MAGLPRQSLDFECGDLSVKLTHTRNIFHLAAKVSEAWRKIDANSSWDTNAVLRPDYKNSKSILMTLSRARAMMTMPAGKHWIKMKLPTVGSKLERSPPAINHRVYSVVTTWTTISDPFAVRHVFPFGVGGALHFSFPLQRSLCSQTSPLKRYTSDRAARLGHPSSQSVSLLFILVDSFTHSSWYKFILSPQPLVSLHCLTFNQNWAHPREKKPWLSSPPAILPGIDKYLCRKPIWNKLKLCVAGLLMETV